MTDRTFARHVQSSLCLLGLLVTTSTASATTPGDVPPVGTPTSLQQAVNVTFVDRSGETDIRTSARTLRDFLRERAIDFHPVDYLSGELDDPVLEGMRIIYRPAVTIAIHADGRVHHLVTSAASLREALRAAAIRLNRGDVVSADLLDAPANGAEITIRRERTWTTRLRRRIAFATVHRHDRNLPVGFEQILAPGRPGLREIVLRNIDREGSPLVRSLLRSRVLRRAKPRIIVEGSAPLSLAGLASAGFRHALGVVSSSLRMVATAYTSACSGCSGLTALGMRAGLGVIAVDPRVIPLGSRVYVSGYGRAIAGDTGGAITGRRVDLGMNDSRRALAFGRRDVVVYVLR